MIDPGHPIHTCSLGALDFVVADFCRFAPALAEDARRIAEARRGPVLDLVGGSSRSAPRHPRPRPAWRVPLAALKQRHKPMLPAAKDERELRLKRRRALAAACHLPQSLRPEFSVAQLAVLAVVAMATQGKRPLECSVAEMARRSFTSPSTVRSALDLAEKLGLLINEDRRRRLDGRSHVNRVTIVDAIWISWLMRRYGLGSKNSKAKRGQNERSPAEPSRLGDRRLSPAQTGPAPCHDGGRSRPHAADRGQERDRCRPGRVGRMGEKEQSR